MMVLWKQQLGPKHKLKVFPTDSQFVVLARNSHAIEFLDVCHTVHPPLGLIVLGDLISKNIEVTSI